MAKQAPEHSTVKRCLGKLLPRGAPRNGLQLLPLELQTIVVRAPHFGNHCALDLLRRNLDVSVIFEQKWWHHVLTRFIACRRGGKAGFEWAFPGLSRTKRSRYAFANYVSTDGVSCSIPFTAPNSQNSSSCKGSSILKEEGRDLDARNPSIELDSVDKLIGIDTGRRDMIVAYDSGSESVRRMSTKQHAHESQRARKAQCTRRALRESSCQLPGYATSNLLRLAEPTPTRKELDNLRWLRYLSHALPLLDARCLALRKPCIRGLRFGNYMRRERSLDLLCQRLMKLGGEPLGQGRVFVEFGDDTRCSTGFGYFPATFFNSWLSHGSAVFMRSGL
uniref:Uncharacterized protein n=1 Tax=viral metagenome TaxID=1070528 RepID=A0A6C0C1Q5_9ZZZZ